MKFCTEHGKEIIFKCPDCQSVYCEDCLIGCEHNANNKLICRNCGGTLERAYVPSKNVCPKCGTPYNSNCCPTCGYDENVPPTLADKINQIPSYGKVAIIAVIAIASLLLYAFNAKPDSFSNISKSKDRQQAETIYESAAEVLSEPVSETTTSKSVIITEETTKKSVETTTARETTAAPKTNVVKTSGSCVVNTNTKKYHTPSCGDVSKIKSENRSTMSEAEAIRLGYTACKHCH